GNNASETGKAANTIRNTNSEPLSEYKESKNYSTDQDHDTNNHIQSINKLDYPQTSIMDKKTASEQKPAIPPTNTDKNVPNSTTIPKPSEPTMNNTQQTSPPIPSAKLISPLSLASTTTNSPSSATFTPLKPIYHRVPPRPTIIARTELSEAEKAGLRAEDATRNAEKEAEKLRKAKEVEGIVARAEEVQMQSRAQQLGENRDCVFGTCGESVAACMCRLRQVNQMEGLE
ncbi:hypothetical protein KCU67_g10597, partial [Aureobasidium melanogenum]